MTKKAPNYTKVGSFGCSTCARRWTSARAQLGVYQKCKQCLNPCYPLEFHWEPPNKEGNMNRETYIGHNRDLCGKCTELGHSCQGVVDEELELVESHFSQLLDNVLDVPFKPKVSQKDRKRQLRLKSLKVGGRSDDANGKKTIDDCIPIMNNIECKLIDISNCKSIGDEESIPLASNLETNKSIKSIDTYCQRDKDTNVTLDELHIHGNPTVQDGLTAIESSIDILEKLLRLSLIDQLDRKLEELK